MWFATGMVMMYVPYPSLPDSDRLAMMETIDYTKLNVAPAAALSKCPPMLTGFRAITLTNRPAYVCHTSDNATHVVYGDNGQLAPHLTASVVERRVHEVFSKPLKSIEGPMDYDQWIVANKFDPYRPFLQVAMADDAGTHYYVSTITGEFLQRTTRHERVWNYLGAVLHWIYPTVLRKDHALWDKTVWWLSLVALVGTASGVYLGLYRTLKVRASGRRTLSSFKENWMRWHHILGLFTGILVLSWIFSGWLSMDHGRLFSTPSATLTQQNLLRGSSLSEIVSRVDLGSLTSLHPASEVTIHALDGEYVILAQDHNGLINPETLGFAQIRRAIIAAWPEQKVVSLKVVPDDDAYTNLREGQLPAGTIRAVLDDSNSTWIHLDAFSGEVLSVMDRGRRVYRWLFNGLHSLDFPWLAKHRPVWDIVMFIGLFAGFSVSVTGTVIGLRRLLRSG